jgi:glycosyltransferase involved in cell wall biosynthesis
MKPATWASPGEDFPLQPCGTWSGSSVPSWRTRFVSPPCERGVRGGGPGATNYAAIKRDLPSQVWPHQTASPFDTWLITHSQRSSQPGAVLLHAPSFAFQAPGGGENQLIQTGTHMEKLGVPVRLFSPWTDRLETARLLHLFGMSREGLELARIARRRGVPVVLSPICWYEPRALAALEHGPLRKLASLAAWGLRSLAPSVPSWRRELLRLADLALPNSRSEANQLVRLFAIPKERIRVVPNGVLPSVASASPELFRSQWSAEPFVLSVGRIEPRKNTLGLIRALDGLGLPLVVIGKAPPGCEDYELRCRSAGRGRVSWLGQLDHHDPLLASAYAAARVFALPSWFETPGLAALEAGLAGCAITVTPFGSTQDYFGDMVEYARPDRPAEIRRAVVKCWEDGADPRLSQSIATRYLWPKVAQITAEVYDQVAR